MSGEFREIRGGFMWQALQTAALEPGRHAISERLAGLYSALQPLEEACAWTEACDSGPTEPVLALLKEMPSIRRTVERLTELEQIYRSALDGAVRKVNGVEANLGG